MYDCSEKDKLFVSAKGLVSGHLSFASIFENPIRHASATVQAIEQKNETS